MRTLTTHTLLDDARTARHAGLQRAAGRHPRHELGARDLPEGGEVEVRVLLHPPARAAYDWSIVRILYPRFLRTIGPSRTYTLASCLYPPERDGRSTPVALPLPRPPPARAPHPLHQVRALGLEAATESGQTNQTQEVRVYSHNIPITRRKCGYIRMMDQSYAGRRTSRARPGRRGKEKCP
eukprot:1181584-Prorocentrum_minimum.AAC.1